MTPREVEEQARSVVRDFSFVSSIETLLRTPATLTMRFRITGRCFIQLYHNSNKHLWSYALVLGDNRIFGRDCEGGQWHRHPFEAPDSHDRSPEGQKAVTFRIFLEEVQDVLVQLKFL